MNEAVDKSDKRRQSCELDVRSAGPFCLSRRLLHHVEGCFEILFRKKALPPAGKRDDIAHQRFKIRAGDDPTVAERNARSFHATAPRRCFCLCVALRHAVTQALRYLAWPLARPWREQEIDCSILRLDAPAANVLSALVDHQVAGRTALGGHLVEPREAARLLVDREGDHRARLGAVEVVDLAGGVEEAAVRVEREERRVLRLAGEGRGSRPLPVSGSSVKR